MVGSISAATLSVHNISNKTYYVQIQESGGWGGPEGKVLRGMSKTFYAAIGKDITYMRYKKGSYASSSGVWIIKPVGILDGGSGSVTIG